MAETMQSAVDRRAMLDKMLLIRAYEEKAAAMQAAGVVAALGRTARPCAPAKRRPTCWPGRELLPTFWICDP